ncbi:MAG: UvrD-helicase domain-containing protein [Phycisphaeraceae bacterium]
MRYPTTDGCFNPTEADERKHLEQVIGRIASELSDYSSKVNARHAEARDLVVDLQENKADMDHVEKANMRQSVTLMTRVTEHGVAQQRRLARLVDSPYFGRIDISTTDRDDVQPIYIGIHSFYDTKAEAQLVHDWRAPIASMFYEFELGPARFEAPAGQVTCEILRKRQYRIERKELLFMLETSLNIQDDLLQKELSRASDDKMKNIVATIQRDQNAIIRNDQAHTLIIQGAAGSGKTSIALHRIAFLLYRYKDTIRSQDILIISPNRVFAHYISQVLPELGEEMIQETTMEELAGRLLGPQVKFQTFAEQVSTLLHQRDAQYAERVQHKATPAFLKQLDAYIAHLRSENFKPTSVMVGLYTYNALWIAKRFIHYRSLPISEQINRLVADIVDDIHEQYQKRITGPERAQVRAQIKQMFAHTTLKAVYKHFYTWLGEPEMFKQLKGGRYEYADVFPLIYLQRIVEGTTPNHRIKHVVIDEMQDYTPVQYQVLANLYPCKKTILGDHNQSVSPASASSAEAIEQVLHQAQCMYMHKSYRSTLQITELAQTIHRNPNLIPIERHGEQPAIIACTDAKQEVDHLREAIEAFHESEHNSLGIICKTQEQADWLFESLGDDRHRVHLLDARSTTFSNGVMIATAYLAKGLEFDQVIVPFCNDEQYHSVIDRHMLYVGCTRAMHKLSLTHTAEPSRFLAPALRGRITTQHRAPY